MNDANYPFVSVIIPVKNDPERLKVCLDMIERQTYPADRFEVIVVDNNSDESIEPIVACYPHARALTESTPGPAAARNRGIDAATGTVLAFTDADCLPVEAWLTKGVESIQSLPNAGLIAGQIAYSFQDADRLNGVEYYEKLRGFDQESAARWGNFSATANMFAHKSVFERVGGFDIDLMTAEDLEWGQRCAAAGYAVGYSRDAAITHPARHTLAALRRQLTARFAGHYQLHNDKQHKLHFYSNQLFHDLLPDLTLAVKILLGRKVNQRLGIRTLDQRLRVFGVFVFVQILKVSVKIRLQVRDRLRVILLG